MILALLSLLKKPVAYNFAVNQQLKVTRLNKLHFTVNIVAMRKCHEKNLRNNKRSS